MIRPMTAEERTASQLRQQKNKGEDMTHANMMKEIRLINAMNKYNLTVDEAIDAMEIYENDRKFQRDLDSHMNNMVIDGFDDWHEGPID
jgi:hypothetical protein